MDKFNCCILWFLCCLMLTTSALRIKQLRVPEIVNLHTHNSAILDCDYEINNTDHDGLVVKWFFGNDPNPVYQWIPQGRGPQALGILKDRLDLNYKATNDKLTMHRALSIKELSLDLSGEYKCVVSTFTMEDSKSKKMIVLDPPEKVKIYQIKEDEDSVSVICSAQGSFPQPILKITYEGSPVLEDTITKSDKSDNGLYNVTTLITLKDETLDHPIDFVCNIHIPDAHYSDEVKLKYYPENAAFHHTPSTWMILLISIILASCFS